MNIAKPCFWARPFKGGAPDPLRTPPPWGGAVGMISGVDSPTCTACAIQRCPSFAYYCFGAVKNASDCPAGDCCQSLRQCIGSCGGYAPLVRASKFDQCLFQCEQSRPHAAQQLADLQHCGDVACAGCETAA